jgi:hypothetical protein
VTRVDAFVSDLHVSILSSFRETIGLAESEGTAFDGVLLGKGVSFVLVVVAVDGFFVDQSQVELVDQQFLLLLQVLVVVNVLAFS